MVQQQAGGAAQKYAHVDSYVADLQGAISSLTESKTTLQKTLLEQIGSFREKLAAGEWD